MTHKLQDLIDIGLFQDLQDRLDVICSFPSSITDKDGKILTATAGQDICTQFHRKNKECEKLCIQSDLYIKNHIHEADPAVTYHCPLGLVDNAMPIIIDGFHCGNFFTGQFFLEEPDMEFFRAQAGKYEFDEDAYLKAVKQVPIWTQKQLDNYLFFIKGMITILSESGLKKLEEIENRKLIKLCEKQHKSILKSTMDGYWLTNTEGRLLEVNDAYCHMSGYTETELLTMCIADLDRVKNSQFVAEHIKKIIPQESDRFESQHLRKDGTVFDVEISVQSRLDKGGQIACFLRDITDSKKISDNLRKSEEKFKSAFHTSPDSINLNSLEDGVYIETNEGFTNITGYSRKDVIGKSSREIHIWDDLKDRERLVSGLKKNGIVKNLEAVFRKKNGETTVGLMSARLLKIEDETVILSITRDISERKQMEADHERFLKAIEQSVEGIVITDIDGKIEYVNPAFEKITGYSTPEILRQNPSVLKSGEQDEPFYHEMWETITSGNTWKGKLINKKKDGSFYTEDTTISPVFDKTGTIINFVAVKRDITDLIRAEKQLQQSQRMEALGTLAGGIAHDFNNILFPIVGHTEILIEDVPEGGSLRHSLDEIYTSALRAKELVRQILSFSRQENNELTLMKIQPIIKEAMKMLRSTIPTSIEMTYHLDNDCGLIEADPTQIHQIVMNLATNAYHAMENTGGKLKVTLKKNIPGEYDLIPPDIRAGNYVCLTVFDTGIGIEKRQIEKIFDPFFTTKETGKGTGMGLSVVHGIVTDMGGTVKVYSKPGKGTEVRVYLPAEETICETQLEPSEKIKPRGVEKILLVDDEKSIVITAKMALKRLGYQVTSYTNSIEALEAFKSDSDKFDLVITDITMPRISGDKLALEMLKIRRGIPIILCTGFSENMSEERMKSMGVKGLLFKPIITMDLAKKIREVLDEPENNNVR